MGSNFMQLGLLLALATAISALSCASNQYYVNDVQCVNCPATCATCSNSDFCTSCISPYYLVTSAFNATCQGCSQIFVGCSVCLSNVACTQCVNGYFIQNGVCTPCSTRNLFCVNCSVDGSTCNQCAYPFILNQNNLCVSQTVSSVIGNTGATTPNTTTPTNLITLANGTQVPPVYDGNGCNQIQIFVYGKCFQTIPQCTLYQTNGLCQYCASGYLVTIFGDCSPSNSILRCESGYWLNSTNDQCVKVSPSCDWYYPNNGSCLNCSTGYQWVNNTCVQSIQCNSRQFFYAGTCVDVPNQCTNFSPVDGTCSACIAGYVLTGGLCLQVQGTAMINNKCTFPCNTCMDWNLAFCYSCVIYY